MTPGEILKQLEEAKVVSTVSLEGQVDPRNAPAWEMQKHRAQESIESLSFQYNVYVDQATAIIFVNGPAAQKFAVIAEEVGNTLTIDLLDFYRQLTAGAYDSMAGTGQFGPNQMAWTLSKLHQFAISNGIRGYKVPTLDLSMCSTHKTPDETASFVKRDVQLACGDVFAASWLRIQIRQLSYNNKQTAPVVPVVVLNASPEEQTMLQKYFGFSTAIVVDAQHEDETEAKNDVVRAFTQLKALLKSKTN